MKYDILKDVVTLLEQFETENSVKSAYSNNIEGFKKWIATSFEDETEDLEPNWEGKENGRSAESVINTLIVHMNRYAKSYSKAAIFGSDFSTQEDFIYLINLK
ncbi:MAG: MarR family winged helix-turn-helix transcriptional regulator, partial [Sphingobacterium sp.]